MSANNPTDTQLQGETLEPCPWCEVPPEVCRAAGYGFTVECVNEVCQVGPALNVTRGRANAIKAWNARRAAVAGPRENTTTDSSLTVEQCLAELREIPLIGAFDLAFSHDRCADEIRITIWPRDHQQAEFEIRAPTLDGCMAQVRKWKQEQVK